MNELELDFSDLLGEDTKLITASEEVSKKSSKKNDEEKKNDTIKYNSGTLPKGDTQPEDDEDEEIVVQKAPSSQEIDEDDTSSKKEASGSFALAFAKFQQDEGVISELNEEELQKVIENDGEVEALRYLLDKQKEAVFEEARKMYSGDKNELEEYFKLKDAGVDEDVAKKLMYNKATFDSVTTEDLEENEDLRKSVLFQHYKNTTSFSDAKIKKEIERTFASGDDIEEAAEALEAVKERTKAEIKFAKEQVAEQEKLYKEQVKKNKEDIKKYIYDTDEIIKGQKINKITQQKIEKMLLEPATKDANGNVLNSIWAKRAEDTKKFDVTLAYLIQSGMFDGKIDNFKKKAKTEVISDFEEILKTKNKSIEGKVVSPKVMENESRFLDEFLGKSI